jgi:hypothetical protein
VQSQAEATHALLIAARESRAVKKKLIAQTALPLTTANALIFSPIPAYTTPLYDESSRLNPCFPYWEWLPR